MAQSEETIFNQINLSLDLGKIVETKKLLDSVNEKINGNDEAKLRHKIFKCLFLIEVDDFKTLEQLMEEIRKEKYSMTSKTNLYMMYFDAKVAQKKSNLKMFKKYVDKYFTFHKTLTEKQKFENEDIHADFLNLKGLELFADKKYDQAIKYFKKSTELQRKLNRPKQRAISLFNTGKIAKIMNIENTEKYLEEAFNIFTQLELFDKSLKVGNVLVKYYREIKDFAMAEYYEQKNSILEDKIRFKNKNNKLNIEYANFREEIDQLKETIISNNKTITALKDDNMRMKEKNASLEKKVSELKNEYESKIDGSRKTENEKITKLEERISSLETQLDDKIEKIKNLRIENKNLKKQIVSEKETQTSFAKLGKNVDEMLASSKLLQEIYTEISHQPDIKLNLLAMKLRVSQERAMDAIDSLSQMGLVDIEIGNGHKTDLRVKIIP